MKNSGTAVVGLLRWQLGSLLHQQVLWLLSAVALALVLTGSVLQSFDFAADQPRFLSGIATAVFWMAGTTLTALLAPVMTTGTIDSRLVHCLFARGFSHGQWIVGAFLALAAVQGWMLVITGGVLSGVFARRGGLPALGDALRDLSAMMPGAIALCAVAVLFAVIFRRPVVASSAIAAFSLATQLEPLWSRAAQAGHGWESWLWRGVDVLVPRLAGWEGAPFSWTWLTASGYCLVYLGMAVAAFEHREI